jgi:hypothetical protein
MSASEKNHRYVNWSSPSFVENLKDYADTRSIESPIFEANHRSTLQRLFLFQLLA